MIHVREGNNKIGKTSNISLPPVKACGKNSAHCKDLCYAAKFYRMYPDVKIAWDDNLRELISDREYYFSEVRRHLLHKQCQYFRWHISGDIIDQDYFERMKIIAVDYSLVNFLVFTKQYNLDFNDIPENLSVVISAWPGLKLPKLELPFAFIGFDDENRYENVFYCPENCETCRTCWFLKDEEKNVYLSVKRS
jgi:hypothetical protein